MTTKMHAMSNVSVRQSGTRAIVQFDIVFYMVAQNRNKTVQKRHETTVLLAVHY